MHKFIRKRGVFTAKIFLGIALVLACCSMLGYTFANAFAEENGNTNNANQSVSSQTPSVTETDSVPVTGVVLLEDEVSMDVMDEAMLMATISPENATNKNVTWKSEDASIATVTSIKPVLDYDAVATVEGLKPGTTTVTVTTEDGGYTDTCTIVIAAIELEDASVEVESIADKVETGSAIEPKPVVNSYNGVLVEGKDYELSYKNNVNPGKATIIISGIGIYTGTVETTFNIVAAAEPEPTVSASWQRLAGATALGTMKQIVDAGWTSSTYAIIVTNKSYQDALSASALAGLMNKCPVLMTAPNDLSKRTKELLSSKSIKDVVIVGGTSAVSENVESQIKELGIGVLTRCAGNTASGTARSVYEYGKRVNGGWGADAIVATVNGYQDALSIAPYAYAKKAPIFLTDSGKGVLGTKSANYVKEGGFTRTLIVGGISAVKDTVEGQVTNPRRLNGATAYGTCKKIAEFCLSEGGMTAEHIGVATGRSYQDALCGAAFCGLNNSILVLADDKNSTNISKVITSNKASLSNCYVFGGESAVSPTVYSALEAAIK